MNRVSPKDSICNVLREIYNVDVLTLVYDDNANTAYKFTKCLKTIGLDVVGFKSQPHPFLYPEQLPIHIALRNLPPRYIGYDVPALRDLVNKAKVIHYFASNVIRPYPLEDSGKIVVINHGGSQYRHNYERINAKYNGFVTTTIIQCPDLLGLGAKNEQWIYYPVDTYFIEPDFKPKLKDKIVIGHFPSLSVKGSDGIVATMEKLAGDTKINERVDFRWITQTPKSPNIRMWTDQLALYKTCDVIIETMAKTQYGRPYGEWGNTALEAAASGCIVVTNFLSEERYLQEFGDHALVVANDAEMLEAKLRMLLDLDSGEIMRMKQASRAWAEKHNIHNTAIRLWDKVYSKFFERSEVGGAK